ncbi:MAG: transglutaminase domain-containing protein [Lachnospiraceae bacterium]|nr:transglutaminase domain-containing protein [Lachnospiraceae bacterium]
MGKIRGGRKAGAWLLAGTLLLSLTGCAQVDSSLMMLGAKKSPYYQLGDTTWEHGGIEEYYFNQIPSELNEIYRELYERIRDGEDEAQLYAQVPIDDFWTAYYAVMADHPEFFWVGTNVTAQEAAMSGRVVSYQLTATVPPEQRADMKSRLEQAADSCIASIPEGSSDYQKIRYVYEYLINTTDYEPGSPDNQNIQSALLNRRSVCAGYARAFQYILHRMGMFCTYVTGKTRDGGDHAWNIVRIGDMYYHVDVTWGDPVFVGVAGDGHEIINYNYLCCTDEEIGRTHRTETSVPMPPCSDASLNFYRLSGAYYEYFDYDVVHQALMDSVYNDRDSIVMKFGSEVAYESAKWNLFSGSMLTDPAQYLMDVYGTGTWNYSYRTDDDFYLITIFWR